MHTSSGKHHVIDLIFPITLFFILCACALILILTAANVYKNTAAVADSNYETTTALSYVTNKIHQSDESGTVSIETFDGRDSLVIRQTFEDQIFTTYIYEYDHALRELFIQDGVKASASDGSRIIDIDTFSMKEEADGLFTFSCTTQDGCTRTASVAVISESVSK